MKGSGLKASRNSKACAKAYVYKQYNSLTSSPYPKAIISRKCKHLYPLQQATFPRAQRYVISLLLLPCRSADLVEAPQPPQTIQKPSTSSRKRKRGQEEEEVERPLSQTQEHPPSMRLQTSHSSYINKKESHQVPASDVSKGSSDPLLYWIQTGTWNKEYFEQDSQVREDFEEGKSEQPGQRTWSQEHYTREPFRKMHAFTQLNDGLVKKKSSASLLRKRSQSTIQTPSDQPSRESKSSQYNKPDYEIKLERKGSYMRKSPLGITDTSRELCRTLLEKEQITPQDTLFRDDLFDKTCESLQGRNEAMVVRDITPLICPSAQVLRIYGAEHLNLLYESVNQAWSNMNKYEGTLPQPDYSVGLELSAFTEEQLMKLKPFVGEPGDQAITYFMATTRIYFPFLTCEVKCGAAALDIADRQNAQSMSIALRALVVLFQYVKREKELHREILTFSISHDHRSVRIYGHYPVIEEDKTTFYRHLIHTFDFTALDGREKWTAYKFVKNVYDHYSPKIQKLICSAIDDLPPDIDFDLSQSAYFSQSTPQSSQQSDAEPVLREDGSQSSFLASKEVTPNTSFTQASEPAFKKPRHPRAGE